MNSTITIPKTFFSELKLIFYTSYNISTQSRFTVNIDSPKK